MKTAEAHLHFPFPKSLAGLLSGACLAACLSGNDAGPAAPSVSYVSPVTDTLGKPAAHAAISTGGPVSRYSFLSLPPPGLALDSGTGLISGIPEAAQEPAEYSIVAVGPGGRDTATVNIRVAWAPPSGAGAARLDSLLFNPKWYRTLDSTNTIIPDEGSLLFAWIYGDALRHPDSFYVGIDTLWMLPQDVNGDTANDWDLQICPDGFCLGGLKHGMRGAATPAHFGGDGEYANPDFVTEHHFQFYPALSSAFLPTARDSAIFGGMMFVRSRSNSSPADTVFGFGAWQLEWDTAHPPPVRPVGGYLPKRSDFGIVDGKVRYLK